MRAFEWHSIPCPKCQAGEGKPCRALTSGRVTDTHMARIDAYWNGYRVASWTP